MKKEITKKIVRNDKEFPDYLRYDKDRYRGKLHKKGSWEKISENKFTLAN